MELGLELQDRPVHHAEVSGIPVDDRAAAGRRDQRISEVVDGFGHLERTALADAQPGLGRDQELAP